MNTSNIIAGTEPFDYGASCELFSARGRMASRQPCGYWRFDSAAEALRFAVENLPANLLASSYLEVNERRFDSKAIRALYDRADYPLARRAEAQVA
jgi:hypothetical protein